MSKGAQFQLTKTKDILDPNHYVLALLGEFSAYAFDEERAPSFKGKWADEFANGSPIDLEIGTGNGFHFGNQALTHPGRNLIGIELKYKPLIQSIRRVVRGGGKNARILRYNARMVKDLFGAEELSDVFIHFPDPWEKKPKHRLIQTDFLEDLFATQKPGGRVFFKTDNRDYFDWVLEKFAASPYTMTGHTFDLPNSEWAATNFITHFERLWMGKGLPIHYAELIKPLRS